MYSQQCNQLPIVEAMKNLKKNVNWEIKKQRHELLRELDILIYDRKLSSLLNLKDVFRTEEIERLLVDSIYASKEGKFYQGERFIQFVARSGYKDRLEEGESSSRRTTPLHLAARRNETFTCHALRQNAALTIPTLFQIYDRFDVNYADEFGLTHFHVACDYGCADVVEKFLQLGQVDRNCIEPETGESPLHLALYGNHYEVAKRLLRAGADPNLTNKDELKPLHVISKTDKNNYFTELFFNISDEMNQPLQVDAQDKFGCTPLHYAVRSYERCCTETVRALLKRGANPNILDKNGMTPFHVCCQKKFVDLAIMLFEHCDDKYRPLQVNTRDKFGKTPLHYAIEQQLEKLVKIILENKADPNLSDSEGSTPLHIICKTSRHAYPKALKNMLLEIIETISPPVQISAQDKLGKTPLHYALEKQREFVEILLENGANPNLADADGLTSLHIVVKRNWNSYTGVSFITMFFDISQKKGHPVQINVRDNKGQTPLHYAAFENNLPILKSLLERGADANLADAEGSTPLHITYDPQSAYYIFQISSEKGQQVEVNARDKLGRTPLHYAVLTCRIDNVMMLLTQGADPNSADTEGVTPLHIVCQKKYDDLGLIAKYFFETCEKENQTVQVNVRDTLGRTPMQWAVARFSLSVVDMLLAHGAELSGFVFPTGSRFGEEFKGRNVNCEIRVDWKLKLASGALMIVERLQDAGYELNRSDALEIMKLFKKYELFEDPEEMEKRWYFDKGFTSAAKEIIIVPSLSLYDLIRLRPDEAEKHALTFQDYYSIKLDRLPQRSKEACSAHLAEKVARAFFRAWALEPFMELIHFRLPILCCEMIIDNLTNQDLYNICVAATIKTDENGKINPSWIKQNTTELNNWRPERGTLKYEDSYYEPALRNASRAYSSVRRTHSLSSSTRRTRSSPTSGSGRKPSGAHTSTSTCGGRRSFPTTTNRRKGRSPTFTRAQYKASSSGARAIRSRTAGRARRASTTAGPSTDRPRHRTAE
ncbi:unnamed protein product [Trichogramma brassicae]|uniref:Uncharacterized protein n=1 Tax=Trichogramma brassicae TaxID=86971 RepID=A0A6H5IBH7_9HYME|nr:unnamed protein product [Trichogramma brassicae]